MWSRRLLLQTLAAPMGVARGQGASSRGVKPTPRGKPSGLPFHARFTDIAAEAGLRAPAIYGGMERKDYILETAGCGAAFLDYDNDGWLDIFLLVPLASRARRKAPATGSIRIIATAPSAM